MKTTILCALLAISNTVPFMASESFLLGASPEELRKVYGAIGVKTPSPDAELAFDTNFGGVRCTIVYRLEKGRAVSALCLVATKDRRFLDSLRDFQAILDCVLKEGKITETSVRLNDVGVINGNHGLRGPKNYIRVSGEWRSEFYFTARLDGDTTAEVQNSGVGVMSVAVNRNLELPVPRASPVRP